MRGDLVGSQNADEPDSAINGDRICRHLRWTGQGATTGSDGRSEHRVQQLNSLEAMRDGLNHQAM